MFVSVLNTFLHVREEANIPGTNTDRAQRRASSEGAVRRSKEPMYFMGADLKPRCNSSPTGSRLAEDANAKPSLGASLGYKDTNTVRSPGTSPSGSSRGDDTNETLSFGVGPEADAGLVSSQGADSTQDSNDAADEVMDEHPSEVNSTTVMLRNIACRYNQDEVIAMLDEAGLGGLYSDVHVPYQNRRGIGSNKGYAFVELKHPSYVDRCRELLEGKKLGCSNSNKRVEVSLALKRMFSTANCSPSSPSVSQPCTPAVQQGCTESLAPPFAQSATVRPVAATEPRPERQNECHQAFNAPLVLRPDLRTGSNKMPWVTPLGHYLPEKLPWIASTSPQQITSRGHGSSSHGGQLGCGLEGGACRVMVRNIACRYLQCDVASMLDQIGLGGLYTGVHVPLSRKSRRPCNRGYAFVLFRDRASAYKCRELLDGKQFGCSKTEKRVQVIPAELPAGGLGQLPSTQISWSQ